MEKENKKIILDLIRMVALVPGVLITLWALKGGEFVLASFTMNLSLIALAYYSIESKKLGAKIRRIAISLLVEIAFAMLVAAFTVANPVLGAILCVSSVLVIKAAIAVYIVPILK